MRRSDPIISQLINNNFAGAPSVQMHSVPDSFLKAREEAETDPDKRQLMEDLKPEHNGEYYDGDSDQDEDAGGEQEAA